MFDSELLLTIIKRSVIQMLTKHLQVDLTIVDVLSCKAVILWNWALKIMLLAVSAGKIILIISSLLTAVRCAEAFSTLRVYAISGRKWRPALLTLIFALVPVGVTIVRTIFRP